jgi:hypothetical protein
MKGPIKPRGIGLGTTMVLGITLVMGIQLGALPMRFRRELWQLQGVVVGLAVGYVLGASRR